VRIATPYRAVNAWVDRRFLAISAGWRQTGYARSFSLGALR
jgi:hypothetical protein